MKKSGHFQKSGGHGGQRRPDGRKPSGGGDRSRPGSSRPGRPPHARPHDDRSGDSRKEEGRKPEGRKPEGRKPDGRKPDGRKSAGWTSEGRKPDSRKPEFRKADPRKSEFRKPDTRAHEPRALESRATESRKPEPRKAEVRPAPQSRGASHPSLRSEREPVSAVLPLMPVDPRAPKEPAPSRAGEVWLYGHHAVAAAIANPSRKILRLMGTTEALAKLTEESGALGQARTCSRREIDAVVGQDAVHQGIALLTRALEHDLADVLELASARPNACIVVLDQVTDPHNVGAILRSAAAFGASAVIAPDRHAADESGAMAKSASGALDKIPYVKATNLVRALEQIKEHQFWLVGLAADGEQTLAQVKLDGKIALVLGAEGEGLRRLVRETCDHIARLPMAGDMESLNVSNAGAVALYEKVRQDSKT